MKTISVLESFSEFPGLRHCNISDKSGEEFYHTVLNKEFKEQFEKGEHLTVNLDSTAGYASSFLDEAFGNLVFDFTLHNVKNYIKIISNQEPHWKKMIETETYLQWEQRRISNENPKVTAKHNAWFRLINNKIISEIWEQPTAV